MSESHLSLSPLTAIGPVDGRYHAKTAVLSRYFSEYALIRYRLEVEIKYFIALCDWPLPELQAVTQVQRDRLLAILDHFGPEQAAEIKRIEAATNHDVKAVEYYVKERMGEMDMEAYVEFVHFGLTSQDINHTALPMMLRSALLEQFIPYYEQLLAQMERLAHQWREVPMLARTHGQPASPTTLGKEIRVFCDRLSAQLGHLMAIPATGKFGGATGNFNAHAFAYPEIHWPQFADHFLMEQLGLTRQQHTTQIEHYDQMGAVCHAMARLNTILLDLSRDVWSYISMEYFGQHLNEGEVGSSAMPHKVNPIDFENAEGNLGMANAQFGYLAGRLPLSRLQRDLTDSTLSRNLGVPFAHTLIALQSLEKGLAKLKLNPHKLNLDLQNNWAVLAEPIQTMLRRLGYPRPYEALKELTRTGKPIDRQALHEFLRSLDIPEWARQSMLELRPEHYTGYLFQDHPNL
mgnify:CR=1 FL=1